MRILYLKWFVLNGLHGLIDARMFTLSQNKWHKKGKKFHFLIVTEIFLIQSSDAKHQSIAVFYTKELGGALTSVVHLMNIKWRCQKSKYHAA